MLCAGGSFQSGLSSTQQQQHTQHGPGPFQNVLSSRQQGGARPGEEQLQGAEHLASSACGLLQQPIESALQLDESALQLERERDPVVPPPPRLQTAWSAPGALQV